MTGSRGIVYLVGAGPGDPGLLTRRGAELLDRADVVAYDRLVHPDILKLATTAELVDVGKQPGESRTGQETINALIVERARAGQTVVRLKGGDPFVFGRGGEEAEACIAAGVAFEVVPGVTSAIAGPAYAGIPLTHRAHASWAAIATGHEEPSKTSSALDWPALARAPTAVFLMGLARLDEITARLLGAGRHPSTPAAVVSWATWPRQRVLRSTLERVSRDVADDGISSPAILVVGDVAALALDWFGARPLAGARVFVTRTRAQAGALSSRLRELGADAVEFPTIRIVPPDSYSALDESLSTLAEYDWCVFTSVNGVEAAWTRLSSTGRDARAFAGVRIAAVGATTAGALRARGIVPDLVPPEFSSEALASALGRPGENARGVLVVQPHGVRETADRLRAAGWRTDTAAAYRTVRDDSSVEAGRRALEDGVDAVLFTSGSTVSNFVGMWGAPPASALVCCIGPRTASACEEAGIRVDGLAAEPSIEGLVATLAELWTGRAAP